jgi:hypothetical protein
MEPGGVNFDQNKTTHDHLTRHPNPNPIRTDCDWCVYIVEIKAMTYQKIEKMALMVKFTDGIVRQVSASKGNGRCYTKCNRSNRGQNNRFRQKYRHY